MTNAVLCLRAVLSVVVTLCLARLLLVISPDSLILLRAHTARAMLDVLYLCGAPLMFPLFVDPSRSWRGNPYAKWWRTRA